MSAAHDEGAAVDPEQDGSFAIVGGGCVDVQEEAVFIGLVSRCRSQEAWSIRLDGSIAERGCVQRASIIPGTGHHRRLEPSIALRGFGEANAPEYIDVSVLGTVSVPSCVLMVVIDGSAVGDLVGFISQTLVCSLVDSPRF